VRCLYDDFHFQVNNSVLILQEGSLPLYGNGSLVAGGEERGSEALG
jgi:hypothetical protein